jgi:hypothetical protein
MTLLGKWKTVVKHHFQCVPQCGTRTNMLHYWTKMTAGTVKNCDEASVLMCDSMRNWTNLLHYWTKMTLLGQWNTVILMCATMRNSPPFWKISRRQPRFCWNVAKNIFSPSIWSSATTINGHYTIHYIYSLAYLTSSSSFFFQSLFLYLCVVFALMGFHTWLPICLILWPICLIYQMFSLLPIISKFKKCLFFLYKIFMSRLQEIHLLGKLAIVNIIIICRYIFFCVDPHFITFEWPSRQMRSCHMKIIINLNYAI